MSRVQGVQGFLMSRAEGVQRTTISAFEALQHLKDKVHVTDAEVAACVRIVVQLNERLKGGLTNIPVDNAAVAMAKRVVKVLASKHSMLSILVTRDGCHCLDLPCGDTAKALCFKSVITQAVLILKLLKRDRVNSIVESLVTSSIIARPPKAQTHPETRMYLVAQTLELALGQKPVLDIIRGNPLFIAYYESRSRKQKKEIDTVFEGCDRVFYAQAKRAHALFSAYKHAHMLASSRNTPMSAYLPTVVALRNSLNQVLSSGLNEEMSTFNHVMGNGADAEVASINRVRFNMDGKDPTGGKVGLLDQYHIWCFLVDPYSRNLTPTIFIENKAAHITAMVNFYLPLPEDTEQNKVAIRKIKDIRRACKDEYMDFAVQSGEFVHFFDDELPKETKTDAVLAEEMKALTFSDIHSWLDNTGGHPARLRWWICWRASSPLFRHIVEPLLSMRCSGSMDVERAAKPLKNKIMTKQRNRMGRGTAEVLARAGMNMRVLHAAKMNMKSTAAEVYYPSDDEAAGAGSESDSEEEVVALRRYI